MLRHWLYLAAVASLFGTTSAQAEPVRGVVELFTSQGCSSCPPADEVLAELATQPGVIALSLPVDYWDRLGWKDTFASPVYSQRQRDYSAVRGDGEVYTPQAVVNGTRHMNGSSRRQIAQTLDEGQARLAVPISLRSAAEGMQVAVGSAKDGAKGPAMVLVMPVFNSRKVAIGRGENAGARVTYTNIVRDVDVAGTWSGTGVEFSVPAAKLKGHDAVVVLLQRGTPAEPGAILGAARLELN
jgi:hypothetical protein